MAIKTTVNIDKKISKKLKIIAEEYNISISFIINKLLRMTICSNTFKTKLVQRIQYQERSCNDDKWHKQHVSLHGDVYEKCQDMRGGFKLSVSFIVSLAFDKYIDDLIWVLENGEDSDNYSPHYFLLYTKEGRYCHITKIWDYPGEKEIQEIQKSHKRL